MKSRIAGGLLALIAAGATSGAQPSPRPRPVSEEASIMCAPQVLPALEDMSVRIVGSERGIGKVGLAPADRLYLARGGADGLSLNSRWLVRRVMGPVTDPKTRKAIGHAVRTVGWVRVETLDAHRSIIRIERACDPILAGDYLRPYETVTIPTLVVPTAMPDIVPSGVRGSIIYAQDKQAGLGTGHFVNVDFGTDAGVAVGDRLAIFRIVYPKLDTLPKVLGEAVVVRTTAKTATAKIVFSRDYITIGDEVAKE